MENRTCKKCGVSKNLENGFHPYKSSTGKKLYYFICKDCRNTQSELNRKSRPSVKREPEVKPITVNSVLLDFHKAMAKVVCNG